MDDTPGDVGPTRPGRAVVVGDDRAELRRLAAILERSVDETVTVSTGREALQEISHDPTATGLVVVDVGAADADLLEVVRAIRADDRSRRTPVLLLVGQATAAPRDALAEAYDLGAVDVVSEPGEAHALRSKVALLDALATKTRELEARTDELRRVEARAEQRQQALVARHSVMRAFTAGGSDDLIPDLAHTLATGLGWEVGLYWVAAGSDVRCADAWFDRAFEAPALAARAQQTAPGPPAGVVRRAVASRLPEWALLSDLDPLDPHVRAAQEAGLSEALAVPITLGPELLGVIELLHTSQRPPSPRTIATLDAIALLVAQFAHARRAEDETAAVKDDFFALVSHEMLTPLTSILGYLEELLAGTAGDLTPDQLADLEVVDRNARRLFRLVDDLMFVAQVEAGKLPLTLMSVDLAAVVDEAIAAARPAAKGRDIRIAARVEPVGTVRGDIRRLGQVVDHLISNAVKFSHDGGPVEVTLRRAGADAVIEVVDQGLGIPLAEQPHVFERFSRSSIASSKEIPGIGLGLSISKVIVEAHGGSVAMRSVEGEGSTFTVTLPLASPPHDDAGNHDQE
ncbi:MAG TPA: hybrid sensor histidine kinase/response regulator [Acidimicrobiales bacterium]|nr:hybrid sensor histidine kinase/response regulator [Acidimicrobiales bacterium]